MLRHTSQAIADFRTAADHLPDRADVYYYLALALDADHKSDDALKAAEEALRLSPDYADARAPFPEAPPLSCPMTSQIAAVSAITGLRRVPRQSISTSTTSPGLSQTGGLRAMPTPGGVPVKIRSPGSSVMTCER